MGIKNTQNVQVKVNIIFFFNQKIQNLIHRIHLTRINTAFFSHVNEKKKINIHSALLTVFDKKIKILAGRCYQSVINK